MGNHRDPKGRTHHGTIKEGLLERGVISPELRFIPYVEFGEDGVQAEHWIE